MAEEFSSNDADDREEPQREDITDTVAARSAPQAFSEIDLDFGTAFKTAFEKIESDRSARILKEEQEAARQSVSLANASENTLEAHFASAFADELALGVASLHAPKAGGGEDEQEPTMRKAHATAQPIRHVDPGQMNGAELRSQPGQVPEAEDFELADSEFDTALQEEMLTSEQEYGAPVRPERKPVQICFVWICHCRCCGGLGVTGYLYYFNSQKAGAPALIRADVDPVKIKPQNQGGTEIANSDKASYERLSGKFSPDAKQEKLVDSAEDPIAIEGSGDERRGRHGGGAAPPLSMRQSVMRMARLPR